MTKVDPVEFKNHLLLDGCRSSTVRVRVYCLKKLSEELDTFDKPSIDAYLAKLKISGAKGGYLNRYADVVRLYAKWKNLDHQLQSYSNFKVEPFSKAIMSDDEIESFLNLPCDSVRTSKLYRMWTMFFSLVAYTGARPTEIAHLTKDCIDWGRNVIVIEGTKTGDTRLVPIPVNVRGDLKMYLEHTDSEYLFPSPRGGTSRTGEPSTVFGSNSWGRNFQNRIQRLGITRKNLSTYSLRHSLITRLLEMDVSLFKVQKLVGHKQIETTSQYCHLTTKDIQNAVAKHPLIRRQTDPRQILASMVDLVKSFELEKDNRFAYSITETDSGVVFNVEINGQSASDKPISQPASLPLRI